MLSGTRVRWPTIPLRLHRELELGVVVPLPLVLGGFYFNPLCDLRIIWGALGNISLSSGFIMFKHFSYVAFFRNTILNQFKPS